MRNVLRCLIVTEHGVLVTDRDTALRLLPMEFVVLLQPFAKRARAPAAGMVPMHVLGEGATRGPVFRRHVSPSRRIGTSPARGD